ncbi:class I SAM-dependent methyltransferase [Candidatus Uhrbacteria bacterium]|nr:class I SAM-dependent methyltransferase [Candidatus Uhrbacteria bacterium]
MNIDNSQAFWEAALQSYSAKDWADKPTIFATQSAEYFLKGGIVLELAAGNGQDSRYFAKTGFDATCTDRSEYGLWEAKRKAKVENISLRFQKVDLAYALPFSENTFDVVYSHLGLHYFTKADTRRLLEEIHRVLKPRGIFAALFNTIEDPELQGGGFEKIEDNYFLEVKTGLRKRYFAQNDFEYFLNGLFEPLILDDKGRAIKDGKTALIRLVARKL